MNQIAQTILEQLGGNRFIAMTGAQHFGYTDNALSFKIGRNAGKVTHVRVTLDPSDTYTVDFLAVRGAKVKTLQEYSVVYADNLRDVFARVTGMAVSL